MSLPVYNIEINQNASFKLAVQLTDSASQPLNITSWSFSGSIKETTASPDPSLMFFNIAADVSSSIITLSLLPSQTTLLTKTAYVYDVIATNLDPAPDEVYRILQGKVKVNPGVTDSTGP